GRGVGGSGRGEAGGGRGAGGAAVVAGVVASAGDAVEGVGEAAGDAPKRAGSGDEAAGGLVTPPGTFAANMDSSRYFDHSASLSSGPVVIALNQAWAASSCPEAAK